MTQPPRPSITHEGVEAPQPVGLVWLHPDLERKLVDGADTGARAEATLAGIETTLRRGLGWTISLLGVLVLAALGIIWQLERVHDAVFVGR